MILPIHQPDVRPITEKLYRFYQPWVQYVAIDGREDRIYRFAIPSSRINDLASIPRVAWSLLDMTPDGLHRAAACVHDEIFRTGGNAVPITGVLDSSIYFLKLPISHNIDRLDVCKYSYMWLNPETGNLELRKISMKEANDIFIQMMVQMNPVLHEHKVNLIHGVLDRFGKFYWGKEGPKL